MSPLDSLYAPFPFTHKQYIETPELCHLGQQLVLTWKGTIHHFLADTSDSAANLPGVYWRSRSSDANRSDANRTISYANSTDQARKTSLSLGCTLRSYQIEWWTQSANLVEPRPAKNIFDFCYIKLDGV